MHSFCFKHETCYEKNDNMKNCSSEKDLQIRPIFHKTYSSYFNRDIAFKKIKFADKTIPILLLNQKTQIISQTT